MRTTSARSSPVGSEPLPVLTPIGEPSCRRAASESGQPDPAVTIRSGHAHLLRLLVLLDLSTRVPRVILHPLPAPFRSMPHGLARFRRRPTEWLVIEASGDPALSHKACSEGIQRIRQVVGKREKSTSGGEL
jgi:hypothetical protein